MNQIAECVYIARLQKGLSQKELAQRAGIPQPNLSQIEKGRDFKVSTLFELALALGVSLEELLRGMPPLSLDKHKFFKRANIEKIAALVANEKQLPGGSEPTVRLIRLVLGKTKGYVAKKDRILAWSTFKRTFSREEINTIVSRVEKAGQRAR